MELSITFSKYTFILSACGAWTSPSTRSLAFTQHPRLIFSTCGCKQAAPWSHKVSTENDADVAAGVEIAHIAIVSNFPVQRSVNNPV